LATMSKSFEGESSKRRHIFIPIVCHELHDGKQSGPNVQIAVRDLGEDGLGFKSKKIYSVGTQLQSEMYLPSRKLPVTPLLTIERVDAVAGTDLYMIGASYSKIDPEHKSAIIECFKDLDLYKILDEAQRVEASDVHMTVGQPAVFRHRGRLSRMPVEPIKEGQIRAMLFPLLNETQIENFERNKELNFAFSPDLETRYRVNLHMQKGYAEAALRNIPSKVPDFQTLGLPEEQLRRFCQEKAGLVLISGKTGAGKTTTLTAMIDFVNKNLEKVVITVEDPIEYVHKSQKSIIKQRELGNDTRSYAEALKHSLRQDPDIIVVSELLDGESVRAAMRAAETGHLVISTIHAPDTSQTVERILNMFPPEHANSVNQQLASCLIGIMFQTLVPSKTGQLVAATELLFSNNAVRTLIREGRSSHLGFTIQTGASQGMYTLEACLQRLVQNGLVDQSIVHEHLRSA